jgi:hypothetical protein
MEGSSTGLAVSEIIPAEPPEQHIPFAPHPVAAAASAAMFGNRN